MRRWRSRARWSILALALALLPALAGAGPDARAGVPLDTTRHAARCTTGRCDAQLRTPCEIAPGVRVRLLDGEPPILLVENTSRLPLSVLDDAGEPFLRITRKGVEIDVRSAAWVRGTRREHAHRGDGPAFLGNPHWVRVTRAATYGWIDRRVAPVVARGADARPPWSIPALLGAAPLQLAGTTAREVARSDSPELVVAR